MRAERGRRGVATTYFALSLQPVEPGTGCSIEILFSDCVQFVHVPEFSLKTNLQITMSSYVSATM